MENALTEIVVLFGAALLAAWLMRILRAPAILGFLIAGILIGPSGFNLIAQQDVRFFAELGLVLLLFVVGLELSVTPLVRSGPRLLLGAVLQLGVTALLGAVLLYAFGLTGLLPAVILGSAAAISSTPVMINYFSDRGQTDSPASVTSTIISLVQDIGSILVLVLLPLLA
ncbi:MAG: potassium transporter KefB, partial [Phycisphaerae bacterium]|nr:potassium transporter KefB [Phycisphaerae bacterium]